MIDATDIRAARARLAGSLSETPCPYSVTLSAMTGASSVAEEVSSG